MNDDASSFSTETLSVWRMEIPEGILHAMCDNAYVINTKDIFQQLVMPRQQ
jgi:hypothetical protein